MWMTPLSGVNVVPRPHYKSPEDNGYNAPPLTAVAIDKDKTSLEVMRWAVNHLPTSSPIIIIHVKNPAANGSEAGLEAPKSEQQIEHEMTQLFFRYRVFGIRKNMHFKEVLLEDNDVAKAIVEYISATHISNIVVGASNRSNGLASFARKFRNPDVATGLLKSAPDFCAVYVIYKGKSVSVRSAKSQAPAAATPPRVLPIPASPRLPPVATATNDTVRANLRGPAPQYPLPDRQSFEKNADYMKKPPRDRPPSSAKIGSGNPMLEGPDSFPRSQRASSCDSFSEDMDFKGLGFGSSDFSSDSLEFSSFSSDSPRSTGRPNSKSDVEAEMKKLRLELKQTMDMYSTACKEAITAKQKARQLTQWKMEDARRVEEARQAEVAALALAEMEKAKCKAAIENAQAAQRLAELEAQKRLHAELKAKREAEEKKKALEALAQNDVRYRKYSIEELEVATEFFSESRKIGEGGYGPVYRATLDHTSVAIKVLRPDAAQGRKQFQQEIEVLSCIRHPNMVLLLGACPEYGCLVYEYMDNGSLEDRLFRRGNTPPIPWSVRFKIAAEIATGLLFLHQTKPEPLVHRDLKPANVLLDRNYVSKISDVGLARLVPPSVADSVTQYRMTSTAGTFCYIDPEYQQTGMLGIKSDIYSLGIMLLQIITAKPPMGLTHHVERAIDRGTFAEMLDSTITDWPIEEALAYAKLALKCAELRRKDRPDLGKVILPELNRLRNLGHAYETGNSGSSSSSFGAGSYSSQYASSSTATNRSGTGN